jgi:hypothetical protein
MLSTFLSQLQSYFSKYFIIGSFCPMLAFAFVNGLAAYLLFGNWRRWVDANVLQSGVGHTTFITTSFVVAILLAAYVLSSLGTFLRRLLEGRFGLASKLFIPGQNRHRQRLINTLNEAYIRIVDLQDAPRWELEMRNSRDEGRTLRRQTPFAEKSDKDSLEEELRALERMRAKNEIIDADKLRELVEKMKTRLATYDVDASPIVERQHRRLGTLIDYAKERAKAHHSRLLNELHSNFGAEEVAPTKMGNVANTIQSYALRRYRCNFEAIWSNLQRVVQKDEKAQAALQEAKTQLDFLVACCWLTLLWAATWSVVLGSITPSAKAFVLVAIGGPILAYMWYRAAAEQYRSFADIAMTTLDAFRFDLLRELRLSAPTDVEEERYIWESFDQLTTYGADRNFRYESPKQT